MKERILRHLQDNGNITSWEAFIVDTTNYF